jgi:hypothetical protein
MTTPPLEKQFGGHEGSSTGLNLLHRTLTTTGYEAMSKAIAEDLDALFFNLKFSNEKPLDTMLISRLQGYLRELTTAVGLMATVLQESGFQIKSTYEDGKNNLSIQKTGGAA